jgi:hypothetical protein
MEMILKDPRPAVERIQLFADTVFAKFLEEKNFFRLIHIIYYGPPQGAPDFNLDSIMNKVTDTMHELIKQGIQEGIFAKRPLNDLMWPFWELLHRAFGSEFCHPEEVGREGAGTVLNSFLKASRQMTGNDLKNIRKGLGVISNGLRSKRSDRGSVRRR